MNKFLEKWYGLTLAFAGLFLGLWISPINNHSEAEDAYMYAWETENLPHSDLAAMYSSHRLYHPLAKLVFDLSGKDRAFEVLAVFSRVVSAAAIVLFFFLLLRLGVESRARAFLLACVFSVSYGVWRYSSEVEIYALTWLVGLGAVSLAFLNMKDALRPLVFGLAGAFVSLIHFGVAIPVGVFFGFFLLRKHGFLSATLFSLIFVSGVIGSGMTFEKLVPNTHISVSEVRGFDPEDPVDVKWVPYQQFKVSSLPKAAIGLGASGIGVAPVMSFDALFVFLSETVFPYRHLEEERFLVEDIGVVRKTLWIAGLVLLGVISVVWFWKISMPPKKLWTKILEDPLVGSLLMASLAYAAMITLFEPDNPEMWVMGFPFFGLLLGALSTSISTRMISVAMIALAATNYVGGVGLLADPGKDWNRLLAGEVIGEASDGDIWLVSDFNSNRCRLVLYESGALSRLFPATAIGFDKMLKEMSEVRQSGSQVFLDDRLKEHPLIKERAERMGLSVEEFVAEHIGRWPNSRKK